MRDTVSVVIERARWGLIKTCSASQIALMKNWRKRIFCTWRNRIRHAPCWGISKKGMYCQRSDCTGACRVTIVEALH